MTDRDELKVSKLESCSVTIVQRRSISTSQKEKDRCFFGCEGAIEDKNITKSVKRQDFVLEIFL